MAIEQGRLAAAASEAGEGPQAAAPKNARSKATRSATGKARAGLGAVKAGVGRSGIDRTRGAEPRTGKPRTSKPEPGKLGSGRSKAGGSNTGRPGKAKAGRSPARSPAPGGPAARRSSVGVDVSTHLTYKLAALTNSLSRSAARDFAAAVDLTVPEWRVIATLGSRGEMSLAGLTRVLSVDKGWISRVVTRLAARGLVSRSPDLHDERLFVLALTRAGATMHRAGSVVSIARQKKLEAALSKAERVLLDGVLAKLLARAEVMEESTGGSRAG